MPPSLLIGTDFGCGSRGSPKGICVYSFLPSCSIWSRVAALMGLFRGDIVPWGWLPKQCGAWRGWRGWGGQGGGSGGDGPGGSTELANWSV